jgi:hypothetical protein
MNWAVFVVYVYVDEDHNAIGNSRATLACHRSANFDFYCYNTNVDINKINVIKNV